MMSLRRLSNCRIAKLNAWVVVATLLEGRSEEAIRDTTCLLENS